MLIGKFIFGKNRPNVINEFINTTNKVKLKKKSK